MDRRRSDDAAWLSRLDLFAAYCIVRFDKTIERFFPFRCSSLPCNQPASHFVIPHFPRFISMLLSPAHGSCHLHCNSFNLPRQLRVIPRGNSKITDKLRLRPESIFWTLSLLLSHIKKPDLDPLTTTTIAHLCKLNRLHSDNSNIASKNQTPTLASKINPSDSPATQCSQK